ISSYIFIEVTSRKIVKSGADPDKLVTGMLPDCSFFLIRQNTVAFQQPVDRNATEGPRWVSEDQELMQAIAFFDL
ncbi:MAG: hypothetical protein VX386_07940, partial [Pseudomonadota bacterium]|nr:hypothetical protein [Pseudomonadota bacterium]